MSQPVRTPSPRLSRRTALGLGAAGAAATAVVGAARPASALAAGPEELERRYAVTLGLLAVDLGSGREVRHRADTRFPMLSTFKTLLVAAVLDRRAHDAALLDRRVVVRPEDVVVNSPICSLRSEMTVAELCDAALRYSDNTAGNLLLRLVGGPPGLTRYVRSLGDPVTRLDRWEPELNEALPGDERDTSTPSALAADYRRLMLGRALDPGDRWLLRAWMQGNTTSGKRFGASLPPGWTLADKTGAGAYATLNDVGLFTAPDGRQVLVAAMSRTEDPARTADNALLRDAAAYALEALG